MRYFTPLGGRFGSVRLQADPQDIYMGSFYMKREPLGDKREPDSWLGTTLRQTPATVSDACLDAETLAAWADGGLSVKAAAAVERHASSCARCTAVLAAMERSAPAASSTHAWTPARVFRWLAPLAAAATAVAIWIAVPDRRVAPVEPSPSPDLTIREPGTPNPELGTRNREPGTPNLEPGTQNLEPGTQNLEPGTPNAEPGTRNLEPQSRVQPAPSARVEKPAAEEQMSMRDELRRENATAQTLGAAADSAAKATSPEAAPPAAPAAPPPAAAPTDALAETFGATARRSTLSKATTESVSPSNPQIRWRIVASAAIERSSDGGKTWTKTNAPASSLITIRAVDGDRAVATTSNRVEFYTTNGGRSWTRVQENSAAPF